jgi:hypothetical protein
MIDVARGTGTTQRTLIRPTTTPRVAGLAGGDRQAGDLPPPASVKEEDCNPVLLRVCRVRRVMKRKAGKRAVLVRPARAPSTIGSWLRAFKWAGVREFDAVTRELLARLWAAGAGPVDPTGPLRVDLDSTICPVYGRAEQGAGFGYTKVRGYHPQPATLAETGQVIFSRLRAGPAGAARGAKSFLAETISRLRHAGGGQLTVRADSAFYSRREGRCPPPPCPTTMRAR